jgi:hypothetical protein
MLLHAGHPDAAHLTSNNHDCGICQVVLVSPSPAVVVQAPSFIVAGSVAAHFVVTKKSLSLLADLRGPPPSI